MLLALARTDVILLLFHSFTNVVLARSGAWPGSPYAIKERHQVPRQWSYAGPAPAGHLMTLQIGLKQSQFAELERHLYEVSDPTHPRYGQHLSEDDVNQLIKPTNTAIDQIHEWLLYNNISQDRLKYSPARDWINIEVPVSIAEKLLDTSFSVFRHKDGSQFVRTTQWSLPAHLHGHVQTIQPTTSFFRPRSEISILKSNHNEDIFNLLQLTTVASPNTTSATNSCNATAVTSLCLRTLYGSLDYDVQSSGNNSIGLTNFLGEASNRSDVYIYLEKYRSEASAAAYNFTVEIVANGDDQQTPDNSSQLAAGKDLEGNLDAETIIGMTWPTPLIMYSTGGSPPYLPDKLTANNTNEPYLTWLQYILAQANIPQVISISYGDDEQTVPQSYATAVCNGFAQLGVRGISVLLPSGDNGVGPGPACFTNDGRNKTTFLPIFPGGCPYVTTVGATMNIDPEIVAHDPKNGFSSGGGFSNYFPRPSYQEQTVTAYIDSLDGQFQGLFNTSGRGYPDISAQGFQFLTIWNGKSMPLDGTSAATPTAASIITLINDALIAAGKPVLGFLNPWIYSVANESFTDVTNGSSIGCNTTGFPATKGWDAVTGFGTPYFPKLKDLALGSGSSISSDVNMYSSGFLAILVALTMII